VVTCSHRYTGYNREEGMWMCSHRYTGYNREEGMWMCSHRYTGYNREEGIGGRGGTAACVHLPPESLIS
jgi:hypothetical protein